MEHVIWPFLQMRAGYREQQKTRSIPALGAHGGPAVRNPPANAGDVDSIPGSERSPGEGNGNLGQDSCLGTPMDRGACRDTVHGVVKESTQQLNNNTPPHSWKTRALISHSSSQCQVLHVLGSISGHTDRASWSLILHNLHPRASVVLPF